MTDVEFYAGYRVVHVDDARFRKVWLLLPVGQHFMMTCHPFGPVETLIYKKRLYIKDR